MWDDNIGGLIAKHKRTGLLVDTNLLVLLGVGLIRPDIIETSLITRTRFVEEDFHTLSAFASEFDKLVITPNILTETSNLLGKLNEPLRSECLFILGSLVAVWHEEYVASKLVARTKEYLRFGLTDAAICTIEEAVYPYLVITDDWPLYQILLHRSVDAINFNHMRSLRTYL